MTTDMIPQYSGSPPLSRSAQNSSENSDPYAAFAELLRQSLDQEQRGSLTLQTSPLESGELTSNLDADPYQISGDLDETTLDLLGATEDFNSLGVLILRTVNRAQEALAFAEQLQLTDQSDSVTGDMLASDDFGLIDAEIDSSGFNVSNPVSAGRLGSVSSASLNLGVKVDQISSAKVAASAQPIMRNAPLPSLLTQRVSEPPKVEAEATKSSAVNVVEDVSDAQNSEIEVSIIRGELGLIIQVATPSMSPRLLKALEQRLTRLVEQSGETVERIEFNTSDKQAPNPIFSILERANNGSD